MAVQGKWVKIKTGQIYSFLLVSTAKCGWGTNRKFQICVPFKVEPLEAQRRSPSGEATQHFAKYMTPLFLH